MEHQEGGREGNRAPGQWSRVALIGTWDFNQPLVSTLGVIWHTRREAGVKEVGEMGDPVKGDGAGHQQEGVG